MFDSVRGDTRVASGRLGTGAAVSIFFHAGLLAVAVILGARAPQLVPELKDPIVRLWPSPSARGSPQASSTPQRQAVRTTPKKHVERVQPSKVQAVPETPVDIPTEAPPEAQGDSAELTGEPVGTQLGTTDGDPNAPPGFGSGEIAIYNPSAGMSAPELLSGKPIAYSDAARAARVEGTVVVRCVITAEGSVQDCNVIKGVALMNDVVVRSLESRRYRPVSFEGRPVPVSYLFNIRLVLPH